MYSEEYADIYHSADGAIEEARHVFLAGNGLPERWQLADNFTIVETGFGCGLNFLVAWDALRRSPSACRVDFVSVEKRPFSHEDLSSILKVWPQLQDLASELLEAYPPLIPGFHRLHLGGGKLTLTLLFGEAVEMLSELDARADAFFLDGFAPARNPDMWSEALFDQLARIAGPGATAATYSSAAVVREGLVGAGFAVEKKPGFGRKRDMVAARVPGEPMRGRVPAKAVVIGAGIAGVSCAFALARRGIEVELLDRAAAPGSGSSANPAAVVRPYPTLDAGVRSRFTWAAFPYAVRLYRELNRRAGFKWHETGVLQLARDPAHREKLVRAVEMLGYPPEVVRLVSAQQATQLCGAPVDEDGIWFPAAGYVDGQALCTAMVESTLESVTFNGRAAAHAVRVEGEMVHVLKPDNRVLASGELAIVANGVGAQGLLTDGAPWLRGVRGQVTGITPGAPGLCAPVCREGYVTPQVNNCHYVGATYDELRTDPSIVDDDHHVNLQRAARILPGVFAGETLEAQFGWAGVRCTSRDRLPVIGPVDKGLLCCLAMGSRGFSWAPLAADAVASVIAGAPSPVERTVKRGLAATRFATM